MLYIHKILFILILLVGLIWTGLALDIFPLVDGFKETLVLTYTSSIVAFWGGAYILGIQYFYIRFIYKDKVLKKYALSIQKDLVVSFSTAIVLAFLYWNDGITYDFNGIDLGFVGIPFGVASIYALFQFFSVKIAGKALRKKPICVMLLVVFSAYVGIAYLLFNNLQGGFSPIKASWAQISVLCFSFVIYMLIHITLVFLQEGKISMPAFQKDVLKGFSKESGDLLSQIEQPIDNINKNLLKQKAEYSAKLRNNQKKKN